MSHCNLVQFLKFFFSLLNFSFTFAYCNVRYGISSTQRRITQESDKTQHYSFKKKHSNTRNIFYVAGDFTNIHETVTKSTQAQSNNLWITQDVPYGYHTQCSTQLQGNHLKHYGIRVVRQLYYAHDKPMYICYIYKNIKHQSYTDIFQFV